MCCCSADISLYFDSLLLSGKRIDINVGPCLLWAPPGTVKNSPGDPEYGFGGGLG